MKLKRSHKAAIHRNITWIQYGCGIASASFGASLKADVTQIAVASPFLSEIVKSAQHKAWWAIPSLMIVLPILHFIKSKIGDPTVWDIIHKLLDEIQAKTFPEVTADHHHRVTLFQHKSWCLRVSKCRTGGLFSGWLIPVERSGEKTQNPKVAFRAPKDNPDAAEGVAGMVWANGGSLCIERLPELTAESKDTNFALYAEKTKISEKELRKKVSKGKKLARSYWGTIVKKKNGVWGVILIDSRSPDLPDESEIDDIYKPVGVCLNKLLEVV